MTCKTGSYNGIKVLKLLTTVTPVNKNKQGSFFAGQ
jgi:hypothetical protein